MIQKLTALIFLVIVALQINAQTIGKDMKISICEGYISPEKALSIIEKSENITFSYNPNNFNLKNEIYLCRKNISLSVLLNEIFGKNTELIISNRHIIVKPAKEISTIIKTRTVKILGTVENAINGLPLDSVSLIVNGQKFYTNNSGYFSFRITVNTDSLVVFTEKSDYTGFISFLPAKDQTTIIFLQPIGDYDYTYMPSSFEDKNPKIENHWLAELVINKEQAEITQNRRNLTDRAYQFSVLPGVGTYYNESGFCRFEKSFNILAGYVGEINGMEIGLGVNIVRHDMTGFQASGIANIVGGEVSGWQLSTGANITAGNFRGAQTSLIANTTWGNFYGTQISTGVNLVRSKFRGIQTAPVNIIIDTLLGAQIGGVNIVTSTASGPQFLAILNYSSENRKFQYSTLFNISEQNQAVQIGTINIAGLQNSFQIGLINIADTVSGFSIGFLTFVKNGFTYLNYSLNTDLMSNLKFETGIPAFYNIIKVGLRTDKEPDFELGYGFGSYFKIWKWIGFNYDLTASQVFENNAFMLNPNIHSQLNLCLNFNFAKHFAFYFGGQLNGVNTTNLGTDAITYYSSLPPAQPLYEKQYKNQRFYLWPSFVLGFRI